MADNPLDHPNFSKYALRVRDTNVRNANDVWDVFNRANNKLNEEGVVDLAYIYEELGVAWDEEHKTVGCRKDRLEMVWIKMDRIGDEYIIDFTIHQLEEK